MSPAYSYEHDGQTAARRLPAGYGTHWTAFGAGIRRYLRSVRALKLFNLAMALALLASVLPILIEIKNGLSGS